jgi:hypothetical protein
VVALLADMHFRYTIAGLLFSALVGRSLLFLIEHSLCLIGLQGLRPAAWVKIVSTLIYSSGVGGNERSVLVRFRSTAAL